MQEFKGWKDLRRFAKGIYKTKNIYTWIYLLKNMANEAVIIELLGNGGDPVRFTVANATAVSAGTLLHLADPRTVVKSTLVSAGGAQVEEFAGIAAADKEANDGATTIAAYTHGIFDLKLSAGSGAVSAGRMLALSGANLVALATDDNAADLGLIVGKALEDSTAASEEVIAVLVRV